MRTSEVVLVGGPGGWVDLHPLRFDNEGDGIQQGLDGVTFAYPAADLVVGSVAVTRVPYISHRLQRKFHTGYDPLPKDLTTYAFSPASRLEAVEATTARSILISFR